MSKVYILTIQRTYEVEADSKEEALANVDPYDYTQEELIEVDWYENLEKPRVL